MSDVPVGSPRRRRRASAGAAAAPRVATLRDVARAASVSTASVSRALNRPASVSAELVERIAATARALGYVPNSAGRSLVSRHSGLVGVVARIDDGASACLIAELQAALAGAGYGLLLAGSHTVPARGMGEVRLLRERGAEAIVLAGVHPAAPLEAIPTLPGVPVVVVGFTIAEVPSIALETSIAAETVVRYLRGLGHRSLAVIAASGAGLIDTAPYVATLKRECGTLVDVYLAERVGNCFDPFDQGRIGAAQLLALGNRPTAIVCDSDQVAAGVLRACQDIGVAVPQTVSVVGFGDRELARQTFPSLTTLRVPIAEIAQRLVAHLQAAISGHEGRDIEPVPLKLIVRASTGEAPT